VQQSMRLLYQLKNAPHHFFYKSVFILRIPCRLWKSS